MRADLKRLFSKRFPFLKWRKLVLFRHPDEFSRMYIEKVNPTHHGIIWGQRKKSLKKGTNYIRVGEIYFTAIAFAYALTNLAWIDAMTNYVHMLLFNVTFISMLILLPISVITYVMPLYLSNQRKVIA